MVARQQQQHGKKRLAVLWVHQNSFLLSIWVLFPVRTRTLYPNIALNCLTMTSEPHSISNLLLERDKLVAEIANSYHELREADDVKGSNLPSIDRTARHDMLLKWYHNHLSEPQQSEHDTTDSQMKWLQGVSRLVEEIESSIRIINSETQSIESEKQKMITQLAGLDEKSKKLLDEQAVLEKEVVELELESNSVNVIRDVNSLSNHKEILITSFSRFEAIVSSLDLVKADPRQHEHLKSKVCSVASSVGLSAIDIYAKRMTQYIESLEGSTLSSVSLFGKFTDTLQVVEKITSLFRQKTDREYLQSVVELEKALSEARQRISVPVIGDYISTLVQTSSTKLSMNLRKAVYFVNSIGKQEQALFESFLGPAGTNSDSFLALLRAVGLGLYYPLRTAVISTSELSDLRESAEILRLEIFASPEYLGFIQSVCLKLHRDIQERLIYRVESFVRDEIRNSSGENPDFVKKTFECLEIITGVVDSQTFHEIANEAVTACVDTLMADPGTKNKLFLIAQLLALRERITLIDCEYSLMGDEVQQAGGLTDQLKRLVSSKHEKIDRMNKQVRGRIEHELKILCETFNAGVVAKTLSLGSDEDRVAYLKSIRVDVRAALKTEGLDIVLMRPILAGLRSIGSVSEQVLANV